MLKLLFVAAIVATTTQTASQPQNCAPRERRAAAIGYARQINTAEAAAFSKARRYESLTQLGIPRVADDYHVQFTTDGVSYAFSIKDQTDACHNAVFSDQAGVIYTGVPLQ